MIKKLLKKMFPKYALHRSAQSLLVNNNSYLHETGWMRSLEEGKPVDKEGRAIPWMNYAVISFLKERLQKDMRLFEFGSGYSTFFYSELVKSVTSVEFDKEWLSTVEKNVPTNVKLVYQKEDNDGDYCRVVRSSGTEYDMIIVDGRDRLNCVRQSLQALSEKRVIILDDSHRNRYQVCIKEVKKSGFLTLDFEGLKPTGNEIDRTTVFYRRKNCLNS